MNENKQNTTLLTVIAVATLLVAVVGATFAYFTASMGNTSTENISTTSGKMVIAFADGNNTVTLTGDFLNKGVQPGSMVLVDKTFTLTGTNTTGNTTDAGIDMPYNVGLRYKNGFTDVAGTDGESGVVDGVKGQGGLVYWLHASPSAGATAVLAGAGEKNYSAQPESDTNKYFRGVIPTNEESTDAYLHLAKGIFPPKKDTTVSAEDNTPATSSVTFTLKITFPDTGVEQDDNKTKSFSGKIVVNDTADTNSVNVQTSTTQGV